MGAFLIGAPVVICAADDFYAYIDGWTGSVIDYVNGYAKVLCTNKDGQLVEFLVPPDQLRDNKQ